MWMYEFVQKRSGIFLQYTSGILILVGKALSKKIKHWYTTWKSMRRETEAANLALWELWGWTARWCARNTWTSSRSCHQSCSGKAQCEGHPFLKRKDREIKKSMKNASLQHKEMQFTIIKLFGFKIRHLQKVNNTLSLRRKTRPTWRWFVAKFLSCEVMTGSEWDLDILRAHVSLGRSSPKQQLMGGWTGELTLNPEPFPLYFMHKIHGMHMWCPLRQVRHMNQKEF